MKLISFESSLLVLIVFCFSCNLDSVTEPIEGSDIVIINSSIFQSSSSDPFNLDSAYINRDSLKIMVGYGGGCGGTSWRLLASEEVTTSIPPQQTIKLVLDDKDNCEAYIQEELSFDISPLSRGTDTLLLLLEGWREITY